MERGCIVEKIKELYGKYREIIMYVIVGGMTTVLSWVAYMVFKRLMPAGVGDNLAANIANVLSWVAAVIFAYVTNKIFVFESRDWSLRFVFREAVAFVYSRLATGVVEWVLFPFFYTVCHLNQNLFGVGDFSVAKVLVSVVVMVLNYIFSKLFVFRKKED